MSNTNTSKCNCKPQQTPEQSCECYAAIPSAVHHTNCNVNPSASSQQTQEAPAAFHHPQSELTHHVVCGGYTAAIPTAVHRYHDGTLVDYTNRTTNQSERVVRADSNGTTTTASTSQ
jgi:hypothetical protein